MNKLPGLFFAFGAPHVTEFYRAMQPLHIEAPGLLDVLYSVTSETKVQLFNAERRGGREVKD